MENSLCGIWAAAFQCFLPVVVGIVDAGQVNVLIAAHNRFGFIEQHAYSHLFQLGTIRTES